MTMNASSTLSRCSYRASGAAGTAGSHESGQGSSHTGSLAIESSPAPGGEAGPKPTGSSRRDWLRSMSSAVLVAIEYSQERSELRPSNPAMLRHARSSAFCAASSASCTEPSIR